MTVEVNNVHEVVAAVVNVGPLPLANLFVAARGDVATSGWTSISLSPRFEGNPPNDGFMEFDFVGDPPIGPSLPVVMPVAASYIGHAPDWLRGVRVHARSNSKETPVAQSQFVASANPLVASTAATSAVFEKHIATYDDSFQPTGKICNWDPWPHAEMKKLRHDLFLRIEGPDESQIRKCVQTALTAGIIAALVAAFVTGGAALPAAISAATSALSGCLGSSYKIKFERRSHWIYWCT